MTRVGRDILVVQRSQLDLSRLMIEPVVDRPRPPMKRRRVLCDLALLDDDENRTVLLVEPIFFAGNVRHEMIDNQLARIEPAIRSTEKTGKER